MLLSYVKPSRRFRSDRDGKEKVDHSLQRDEQRTRERSCGKLFLFTSSSRDVGKERERGGRGRERKSFVLSRTATNVSRPSPERRAQFSVTIFSLFVIILAMLYTGDKVNRGQSLHFTDTEEICLLHHNEGPLAVNAVIPRLIESMSTTSFGPDSFFDQFDVYVSVFKRFQEEERPNELYSLGSFIMWKEDSVYVNVLSCDAPTNGNNVDLCADPEIAFVGELRSFVLFGDFRTRRFVRTLERAGFNEKGSISTRIMPNPKGSPWFENAIGGPQRGVWSAYGEDTNTDVHNLTTAFSKSFRLPGNTVTPSVPGGGVVVAVVAPGSLNRCVTGGLERKSGKTT